MTTDNKQREDIEETKDMLTSLMSGSIIGQGAKYYKGVIFIKVINNKITNYNEGSDLEESEYTKLLDWVNKSKYSVHTDHYNRIDFEKYIIIFKGLTEYNTIDGKSTTIAGHIVERNAITRVALMEARTNHLERKFVK